MKPKFTIMLVALVLMGAAGFYVAYTMYNKPHPDYVSMTPVASLSVEELFMTYTTEPGKGNEMYTGKLIEVTGVPARFDHTGDQATAVFVLGEGLFGEEGVRCLFHPEHIPDLASVQDGKVLKIKGYCTGYNETDVLMEQCTLVP